MKEEMIQNEANHTDQEETRKELIPTQIRSERNGEDTEQLLKKLYIVGIGPGKREGMTLEAAEALSEISMNTKKL